MDHPNIIKMIEVIDDPNSDKLYLIMPLAEFGECMTWDEVEGVFLPNQRLQATYFTKAHKQNNDSALLYYSEDLIKVITKQLVDAIDYLHNTLNIVHRDIKP